MVERNQDNARRLGAADFAKTSPDFPSPRRLSGELLGGLAQRAGGDVRGRGGLRPTPRMATVLAISAAYVSAFGAGTTVMRLVASLATSRKPDRPRAGRDGRIIPGAVAMGSVPH